MSGKELGLKAIHVSLAASFAGVYAILSVLPAFKILGGQGFINTSAFIEPVIGIVLGPYVGSLSVLVGRTIADIVVPSSPLGPFSPVPGVLTAFSAGMTGRGRWYVSTVTLFALIVVFLVYPYNQVAPVFPYYVSLHTIAALILILLGRMRLLKRPFLKMKTSRLLVGLALAFFPATLTGQLGGTLIWEFLIGEGISGMWKTLGTAIMLAFPVERTLITIVACLLGVALIKALESLGVFGAESKAGIIGV